MLWELSVAEQRYRAVVEVGAGVPVTDVAERHPGQGRPDGRDQATCEPGSGHTATAAATTCAGIIQNSGASCPSRLTQRSPFLPGPSSARLRRLPGGTRPGASAS